MINYLNNRQNRKTSPNENFAREVMELFTLGRDNIYSENDIKEAARAFTGWTMGLNGEFIKREGLHDYGKKTFLGSTGSYDGEDILNIILEQKQTARHITAKLYRYLVNDEPDEARIQSLAESFFQSRYDITSLLSEILLSEWFYDQANRGILVKSPVEYIVGIQKQFHMELQGTKEVLYLQTILGQQLLYPPNVAGWPGGLNWIDSGTLLTRMNLPQLLLAAGRSENHDDPLKVQKKLKNVEININWKVLQHEWQQAMGTRGFEEVVTALLLTGEGSPDTNVTREEFLESMLYLTKLPEYQMC